MNVYKVRYYAVVLVGVLVGLLLIDAHLFGEISVLAVLAELGAEPYSIGG